MKYGYPSKEAGQYNLDKEVGYRRPGNGSQHPFIASRCSLLKRISALLMPCILLCACDSDDFSNPDPTIHINTPTQEATFSVNGNSVNIGGVATYHAGGGVAYSPPPEVRVINTRTGKRFEVQTTNAGEGSLVWNVAVTDLQLGENHIFATLLYGGHVDDSIVITRMN